MPSTELENLHQVSESVFRSAIVTPDNFHTVVELGIKSIVSMKTDILDNALERHLSEKRGIKYCDVPITILDISSHSQAKFYEAERLLHVLPTPILVHCTHGKDRTGIVIAMYQMLHLGYGYDEAMREMDFFGFNPLFCYWKLFLKDLANSIKTPKA